MGILKVSATIGLGGGPRLRIRKVKKTFRLPLVSPVSVPILKNDNLFLRGEFEGGERFGVRGDGDKAVTKTGRKPAGAMHLQSRIVIRKFEGLSAADTVRAAKEKNTNNNFSAPRIFMIRRATLLCMTPSNVREGCNSFLRNSTRTFRS
jgi:hypothetical protein